MSIEFPHGNAGKSAKHEVVQPTFWAEKRSNKFWAALLAILVFLVFGNTLQHGYNMDDELVTQNHRLTSDGISGILEILTSPYYADNQGYSYEYRPLTLLTFALENEIFGESPFVGHFMNILLFSLTVILVFHLIKGFLPNNNVWLSLLISLLFLVHPLHTEAVSSIKNREELLSLFGGLLALYATLRLVRNGNWTWLLLMTLALMMGLLAKLSVLSFVVIVPIWIIVIGGKPIQFWITTTLMALTLGLVLWLRTTLDFSVIMAAMTGLVFLQSIFLLVFRPTFLSLLCSNTVRTFNNSKDSNSNSHSLDFRSFVLVVITLGLMVFGVVVTQSLPITISIGILFFHPLLLGNWIPALTGIGTLGLTALAPEALQTMAHLPFYFVALASLFLFKHENWFKQAGHWLIVVGVIVGIITVWHLGELEWGGILSKLAFVSLVFIIAQQSFCAKFPWLRVSIILAITAAAGLTIIKGFKWEVGLLAIGIAASEYIFLSKRVRQIIGAAFLMAAFVSVTLSPLRSIDVREMNAPVTFETLGNRIETKRPALDEILDNNTDRPLAYTEYPLGFDSGMNRRLGSSFMILGHYLKMMLIPWPQSFYYGFDEVPLADMKDSLAIVSTLIHLALILLALILAPNHPILSFGFLSYLTSIFLFSNLFEPVAGMIADRLTYVASFGYCIALGYALTWLYERQRSAQGRSMVAVGIVLLLVTYSGMTIARNAQWKDALTLMRHDIENVPNSAQAHNLLASHLMKNSFEPEYQQEAIAMRLEAIDHFKRSIRIYPDFFNVWYDLGRVYLIIDDPESALPCFKEAHRLDSTYYDATFNVAMIADKRGDATTAITYYEKCIRINPEMLPPYNELSYLLYRLGEYEASIAVNEKAIAYNANWPDPYKNIAQTYAAMNQPEKGQAYLQRLENMK
jgi:hypothetical protein